MSAALVADEPAALAQAAQAEIEAAAARDDRHREFGLVMWRSIADAHGPEVADAVMSAFVDGTRPATGERRLQDRIHTIITARLDKICDEART